MYNRTKRLNRNGTALIQIRAYQEGKSKFFTTDVWVSPEYWDKRNHKVKHTHPNQFVYNKLIMDQLATMEAYEISMINRTEGRGIPLDLLPDYQVKNYEIEETVKVNLSFTAFYKAEVEQSKLTHKKATISDYSTTFNKLNAFRKNILFEELSYNCILSFDRFLHGFGFDINYIKKQHKNLRKFINLAIKKGYLTTEQNPYIHFKPRSREPKRVFLTKEELHSIEQLEFSEELNHLYRVKDIFLFSSYTGLRFSDIKQLSRSNFSRSDKGFYMNFKSQKTGKVLALPLYLLFRIQGKEHSRAEAIIQKYLDAFKALGNSSEAQSISLFSISNQYYNRALKEIAKLAGIHKNLSSHVARRTFATQMATKVQMPVLQKLLQHSKLDMTRIYVQLSNQLIEQELGKIKW